MQIYQARVVGRRAGEIGGNPVSYDRLMTAWGRNRTARASPGRQRVLERRSADGDG